jgi:hypothetical protein
MTVLRSHAHRNALDPTLIVVTLHGEGSAQIGFGEPPHNTVRSMLVIRSVSADHLLCTTDAGAPESYRTRDKANEHQQGKERARQPCDRKGKERHSKPPFRLDKRISDPTTPKRQPRSRLAVHGPR